MTHVSPAQAMESRYYGIGGWLLVIYVLFVLNAVLTLLSLVDSLDQIGLSEAELVGISPELGSVVYAIKLALALPFLVLTPMKHPQMPMATIICMWASVAASIVYFAIQGSMVTAGLEQQANALYGQQGASVPDGIDGIIAMTVGTTLMIVLGISVLFSAIVTWYLLASKRVNATFRHRIPGGLAMAAMHAAAAHAQSADGMPSTGVSPTPGSRV